MLRYHFSASEKQSGALSLAYRNRLSETVQATRAAVHGDEINIYIYILVLNNCGVLLRVNVGIMSLWGF